MPSTFCMPHLATHSIQNLQKSMTHQFVTSFMFSTLIFYPFIKPIIYSCQIRQVFLKKILHLVNDFYIPLFYLKYSLFSKLISNGIIFLNPLLFSHWYFMSFLYSCFGHLAYYLFYFILRQEIFLFALVSY